MLDLGRLEREHKLGVEADLPAEDPLLRETDVALDGPLAVRLQAQQAGPDVVVLGRLSGRVALPCRRCLEPVRVPVEEDVAFLYRPDLTPEQAEEEDVYTYARAAGALDLGPAVRETVLLAVPRYAVCREACRGLCPQCGRNRNEGECECTPSAGDERWAVLRKWTQE